MSNPINLSVESPSTYQALTEATQGNGITYDLWRGFPFLESLIYRDSNVGFGVYPNFANYNMEQGTVAFMGSDGVSVVKDASNTISPLTKALGGIGGGIRIAQHATDNHETYMQWCGTTGSPFVISDTAAEMRDLIFEFAFRTSTITATHSSFFIGLAEETMAAADAMADNSGLLADKDFVGVFAQEDTGNKLDIIYRINGGAQQTVKADWQTLVAATWYHVGMHFNTVTGTVTFWFGPGSRATAMEPDMVNIITAANIAAVTFPDGQGLAPFFGIKQSSANGCNFDIRLLACAQKA